MPYLRCPNCGLLAHVTTTDQTPVVHCPRCRALQHQKQLEPLEQSLQTLTPAPEQGPQTTP
jgi:uncharacterized paraquat-inducible protein A